jgi:HAD superfamily hydrolase (TIGR01509 family)
LRRIGRPLKPVRGLILDFDGVLVDTEACALESWSREFAARGKPFSVDLWRSLQGRPDSRDILVGQLDGRRPEALTSWLDRVARSSALAPLRPGVVDLLDAADRHGVALAVASSATRDWVLGHLDRLGVLSRFRSVVTGENLPAKPNPAVYLEALRRCRLEPDQVVAVEDSPPGIAAARAAGIFCVGVPSAGGRPENLAIADLVRSGLPGLALELFGATSGPFDPSAASSSTAAPRALRC